MTLIRITAPASYPVTTADAKANGRIDYSDEDALIASLISAATSHAERYTGLAFVAQTWEAVLDSFPADLDVTLGPIVSITSIKYLDIAGVEQTVPILDYVFDNAALTARIRPVVSWPAAKKVINSVRVRFVVGSGCPDEIKQAILMLVQHWWENRAASSESGAKEVPMATTMLLDLHRRLFV